MKKIPFLLVNKMEDDEDKKSLLSIVNRQMLLFKRHSQ